MAARSVVDVPCCDCCGARLAVMKRCVQCRTVYYCSRKCQSEDWLKHKTTCLKTLHTQTERYLSKGFSQDEKSIFADYEDNSRKQSVDEESTTSQDKKPQRNDLSTSAKAMCTVAPASRGETEGRPVYLHNNTLCYDLPVSDSTEQSSEITVKCNKSKVTVSIKDGWNGSDIFKVFACQLQIPLEQMKIIHKGKLLSTDTIREALRVRTVVQVIGEKRADETGVNKRSIEIMMSQLNIDRSSAVRALQRQPDLLEAMMETANSA